MAEMNKITSFKTFTELKAEQSAAQLAEERAAKRGELATKLTSLLDEMDITSFDELDEETLNTFLDKAFGDVSEEITEGRAFVAAAKKAKDEGKEEFEFDGKTYPVLIKESEEEAIEEACGTCGETPCCCEAEEVSEAIVVTGKRDAKKVMNTYIKFFEKYPALSRGFKGTLPKHHTGAVRELYAEAMIDANFSRELPATKRAIPGVVYPVDVKVAELNNALIRISAGKLMDICAENGSIISGAAKFQGLAIVEGTAMYLDSIGYTKEAEDLMARFNKAVNEDVVVNEGAKEEQEAMEIYTEVAGPEGAYSEAELAKGDMDLFMEIVTASGHKGSKAKKIADEFRKIATMESKVNEGSSKDFDKALDKYAKKGGKQSKGRDELITAWNKLSDEQKAEYFRAMYDAQRDKLPASAKVSPNNESVINEAEINSDEEFSEYAMTVLQKAFGEDFDEAKAKEVIDGILGKVDGDYGAAVGMLTSSLG